MNNYRIKKILFEMPSIHKRFASLFLRFIPRKMSKRLVLEEKFYKTKLSLDKIPSEFGGTSKINLQEWIVKRERVLKRTIYELYEYINMHGLV